MGAVKKISIALTEELAAEVEQAVASGDYASTSEVIREALRGWKGRRADREAEIAGLRALWEEGLASGEPKAATDQWFESIRARGTGDGFGMMGGGARMVDPALAAAQFRSMTLAGFPRIAVDNAVCGDRPTVAGTRVRVTDILEMLAGGASEAEIVADFPYVTAADIRACLAYAASAADHPVVIAAE